MSVSDSDDYLPRRSSPAVKAGRSVYSGFDSLPIDRCLDIFRLMVRTRALEERSIKMSKSGEAYFWVGGPGEEAFNVCLGLHIKKGRGPAYDYLHLHYRNAGVVLAMGMPMLDHVRQMAMTSTDRHSMGRNFVGHYAIPEWNIPPVSSVIEVQYVVAPGTALMQKRHGGDGVSVVIGGEAGAAEGDFNSCMLWSTRPDNELPVLMVVTNNGYGISTPVHTQQSTRHVSDRGEPFGIPGEVIDGNDPISAWMGLERAFDYVRQTRRPYLLEAMVSRLHGHSSSSGAARNTSEPDCLKLFEQKLLETGAAHREWVEMIYHDAHDEVEAAVEVAMNEPRPTKSDVERFTFAPSPVDAVYPNDYTGLPPS